MVAGMSETLLIFLMMAGSQLGPEPARSMYSVLAWRSAPISFLLFTRGAADGPMSGPAAIQVAPPPPPPAAAPPTK
jgi:hypothetical protein